MECYKCGKDKPLSEFYKRKQKVKSVYCTHITQCKSCLSEAGKEYRKRHPEKIKEYRDRKLEKEGKEIIDSILSKNKKNKLKASVRVNSNGLHKRNTDPLYKMRSYLRSRIYTAFKQKAWKKESITEKILGSDYKTICEHLESLFTDGMNWRNHGKWHIDHKKPLACAKNADELLLLCHYTNLQPVWAKDNLKKGKKYYEL